MAELHISQTLLDAFDIREQLGESNGIYTYHVRDRKSGKAYVLKHLSFPASDRELEALRYIGAVTTDEEAKQYYEKMSQEYLDQLQLLDKLSERINLANFSEYRIEAKESGVGFDLYLLSPMRETLEQHLARTPIQHLTAANLAIDLCTALADLRECGLVHCNIKPSNIYLNAEGHFMLGDLGLYRIVDLKYASVPERMIGSYSAPELYDVLSSPTKTSDIYSIGLILYSIYNGGHRPFEDEETSEKDALARRTKGDVLPAPIYADYELTEILLKACAFKPEERYATPQELRDAFSDYVTRNHLENTMIVPPIVTDADTQISEAAMHETAEPVQFTDASKLNETFVSHFSPDLDRAPEAPAEEAGPALVSDVPVEGEQITMSDNPVADEAPAEPEKAPEAPAEVPAEQTEEPAAETPETEAAEQTPEDEPTEEQASEAEEQTEEQASDEEPSEQTDAPAKEPEAPAQAEEQTPAEAPAETEAKPRKKFPVWAWILCGLAVSVLAAGTTLYLLTPQLNGVTVKERTTDSMVLTLDADCTAAEITVYATDSYGNVIVGEPDGQDVSFSTLAPATQYTFHAETLRGYPVRGTSEFTATTLDSLDILYFTAKPISGTQAELNFSPAGGDSENWRVDYSDGSGNDGNQVFSGHSIVLTDLLPDRVYTFTLSTNGGLPLTGITQLSYNNSDLVKVRSVSVVTTTADAEVTWEFDGEPVGNWTALLFEDGEKKDEQSIAAQPVKFENLDEKHDYLVEVYCNGMKQTAKKDFRTNGLNLTDFTAEVSGDSVDLTWSCEQTPEGGWSVICTLDGQQESRVVPAAENSATVGELLPNCTYRFEIRTAEDEVLGGKNELKVSVPDGGKFTRYGCTAVSMSLYQHPEKESWTYRDLSTPRTEFTTEETVAFAVQALSKLKNSKNSVSIICLVRSEDGGVVDYYTGSEVWNNLWVEHLYVGELKRPVTAPGTYKLEVYFNRQLLAEHSFQVNLP